MVAATGELKSRIQPRARFYYYILKVDDGAAPCVEHGLLTLGICKPAIRRKARKGDWIIGVTPKELGWKLAYAGRVSRRVAGKEYYVLSSPPRLDRIYEFNHGKYRLIHRDIHNESSIETDLCKPPAYKNAWVLECKRFWYFGREARQLIEFGECPNLMKKLARLNQGHRVNHSEQVRLELQRILQGVSRIKNHVLGEPREPTRPSSETETVSRHHGAC